MPDPKRLAEIKRHWIEAKAEDGFGYWPHRGAQDDIAFLLREIEGGGWRPITETVPPRHGNYVRVYTEDGALYCPLGGEATHYLMLPSPPTTSDGGRE